MNGGELWIVILVLLTTIILLIGCHNGEKKERPTRWNGRQTQGERSLRHKIQRAGIHTGKTYEIHAGPIHGRR